MVLTLRTKHVEAHVATAPWYDASRDEMLPRIAALRIGPWAISTRIPVWRRVMPVRHA